MPGRVVPVLRGHLQRLPVAAVPGVVAAAVAQVDAAGEGDVPLRAPGCRSTTSFWWCEPPRRTRWSSSTSPPAPLIASPRCRFSSSL